MVNAITTGLLIGMIGIGNPNPELLIDSGIPFPVEATAYCNPHNRKTRMGKRTVENLTIAGAEYFLDCTAYVYNEDMTELLGIYQFTDTGSDERLKNGKCIDIFIADYDECIEFGRQNVQIIVNRGKG